MNTSKAIVICALILSSYPVYSGDFRYHYFDIGYVTTDIDIGNTTVDGDGLALAGSFPISDSIAFTAGYEDQDFDFDINTKTYDFGIDFHTSITESTDFVAGVSIINAEISVPFFGNDDDTGNVLSAGVRTKLNQNIELEFSLSRVDVFDDSETGADLSLLFGVSKNVQLGVTIGKADDTDALAGGVRINF